MACGVLQFSLQLEGAGIELVILALLGDELAIAGAPCGIDSWYLAGHRDGARCFSAELQFDRG